MQIAIETTPLRFTVSGAVAPIGYLDDLVFALVRRILIGSGVDECHEAAWFTNAAQVLGHVAALFDTLGPVSSPNHSGPHLREGVGAADVNAS